MAYTSKTYIKIFIILLMSVASSRTEDDKPPDAVLMDEDIYQNFKKDFTNFNKKLVLVGSKQYILPAIYVRKGSLYYNFEPKHDDIILVSFPKSGHSLLCEVISLLTHNLNYSLARTVPIADRYIFLESELVGDDDVNTLVIEAGNSPRLIYSQLPFSLIPKIANSSNKIIYLVENPKDNMINRFTYVRHRYSTYGFLGDLDRFSFYYINDLIIYSPYWHHLKEAFAQETKSNILIVHTEETILKTIYKLSKFLELTYTKKQLKQLAKFTQRMYNYPVKELWKNAFKSKLNKKINNWIMNNIDDITFPNIKIYS